MKSNAAHMPAATGDDVTARTAERMILGRRHSTLERLSPAGTSRGACRHRVVVLYDGRIMEQGDAWRVYKRPVHPYTKVLLAAAPVPDPHGQRNRRAARARGATTVGTLLVGCHHCREIGAAEAVAA